MIRNLNQMNFHEYGTVLTERPRGEKDLVSVDNSLVLDVSANVAQIYRVESDTWISSSRGKIVLSVSKDGKRFLHFGLDKPVCVNAGIFVSLNAIFGDGAISYTTKTPVEPVATRHHEDFAIPSQLQIEHMGSTWLITGTWLERLIMNINFDDYESRNYFDLQLRKCGLFKRLEDMGIQDGDVVDIYDMQFEYQR